MKTRLPLVAASMLLAVSAIRADGVYQCREHGVAVFTDEPDSPTCQPMDLKVIEPNPEDVARLEAKKRQDAERDREAQAEAEQRRLLRAQEEAAHATARAAEAQRRLAEQQAREPQPPAPLFYGWPRQGYPQFPPYLQPFHNPPAAPPSPPPVGIDHMGPRGKPH